MNAVGIFMNEIVVYSIMILVVFGIPGVLTFFNFYNLFAKEPKLPVLFFWLTTVIGGILYVLLYAVLFETAGNWDESIYAYQKHYSISSHYLISLVLLTLPGIAGLILLVHKDIRKLPPLVSAGSTAAVAVMNIVQIVFAVQLIKNFEWTVLFLYVYHLNIFVLSVSAVKRHVCQLANDLLVTEDFLSGQILSISQYSAWVFIFLFAFIVIVEILFILFGQGWDAPIKAFTDTADWTFSQQIPPPPKEYHGHYLCTVAAGGHKKVVKPLRFGRRQGAVIIVNRQLCIANAFEDFIQEKMPRFHKFIRHVYDTYGYPVSRHITTPLRADTVYLIMKPLEWAFLIFLYLFDCRPEERIRRQYL